MKKEDYKIHIVGSGISGLIAAQVLEKHGYQSVILEATDSIGGRVKTDIVEGYQLDHGFQVLLNAYPKAKEYLDYEHLDLQAFVPGATIFSRGNMETIGDPLRDLSLLFPTLKASVGSLSDKINILKLNIQLKKKSIEAIFNSEPSTTLEYLKAKGFSDKIIDLFFKPFFSGIFLEPDLKTSSRMFEFVYKMFGEGQAVLPKGGIVSVSNQLKEKLNHTEFHFNKKVKAVEGNHLVLENGTIINTDYTIIAAPGADLVLNSNDNKVKWKSCYNLYFEVANRKLSKPIIGLIADKAALVNNIFFHNSIETHTKGVNELLSVTVVKQHNLSEEDLVKQVKSELKVYCDIDILVFLKCYHIKKALPDLNDLKGDIEPKDTQLKPTIYLAGDYLLNGSLNAAMLSGERAAEAVMKKIND